VEEVFNPYRDLYADMTPIEFEEYCIKLLCDLPDFSSLQNVITEHNKHYVAYDGEYQLDGYMEYTALGVRHKVVIECKKHTYPIKREIVATLHTKIISLGAQKGILMSTSGYQSGAATYAKQHGIALLQVIEGSIMTIQMSSAPPSPEFIQHCRSVPKHITLMYDLGIVYPMYRLQNDNEEMERFLLSENKE